MKLAHGVRLRFFVLPLVMMMLTMVLSACDWFKKDGDEITNISISQSEPTEEVVDVETITVPCRGGLKTTIQADTAIKQGLEFGATTRNGAGAEVSIPQTAKVHLETQIQEAYRRTIDTISTRSRKVEMTPVSDSTIVYEIEWVEHAFESEVSYMLDGKPHQTTYTFWVTVPDAREKSRQACSTASGSDTESKWEKVGGTWAFDDEIIFSRGITGFNKAYIKGRTVDDLTFEVTFRKTSNNDGPLGVMIRYDEKDDEGYLLLVWPLTRIYQFSAMQGKDRRKLAGENLDSIINQGDAWNTVAITAVGSQLTVSINGNEIASLNDNTFSSGSVGLVIHGESKNSAEFKDYLLTER